MFNSAAVAVIVVPPNDNALTPTVPNPVIALSELRITALLAVACPAVTPSNCAISLLDISASPIINVPPVKNNLRHGLAAEPKSNAPDVVGNRSADILFGSNPPPTVDRCIDVKFLKFKNSFVN